MTTEITQAIPTVEAVSKDIAMLRQQFAECSDQIFKLEQGSRDYRRILAGGIDPSVASSLEGERIRLRSLELALEEAELDLERAKRLRHKNDIIAKRSQLRERIEWRNSGARSLLKIMQDFAAEVVRTVDRDLRVIEVAQVPPGALLGKDGYLVIEGVSVLNDPEVVFTWIDMQMHQLLGPMWPHPRGQFGFDIVEQFERTGRNVLMQWDLSYRAVEVGAVQREEVPILLTAQAVVVGQSDDSTDPGPASDDVSIVQAEPLGV